MRVIIITKPVSEHECFQIGDTYYSVVAKTRMLEDKQGELLAVYIPQQIEEGLKKGKLLSDVMEVRQLRLRSIDKPQYIRKDHTVVELPEIVHSMLNRVNASALTQAYVIPLLALCFAVNQPLFYSTMTYDRLVPLCGTVTQTTLMDRQIRAALMKRRPVITTAPHLSERLNKFK